jgi:hypothetical protein
MDYRIYLHTIEEIQTLPSFKPSALTHGFIYSSPDLINTQSIENIKSFLIFIINSPKDSDNLFFGQSLLLSLFYNTHIVLIDALNSPNPALHAFRSNGIQLCRFLSCCAQNGIPYGFFNEDPVYFSMLCFLLEALMYCNFCSDSFDGIAKRSAHEYCITAKKILHYKDLSSKNLEIICAYLLSAWVLANKTEGLKVADITLSNKNQSFTWHYNKLNFSCILCNPNRLNLFYLIIKQHVKIPHPVKNPLNEEFAGITLFCSNEVVKPEQLIEFNEITRINITGHEFNYKCNTSRIKNILWKVIILLFKNTFYRIDSIQFPDNIENATIKAEICLETADEIQQSGTNTFSGTKDNNELIEFIDTPFVFNTQHAVNKDITRFISSEIVINALKRINIVTVWSFGKNIKQIDRTFLLGIYD